MILLSVKHMCDRMVPASQVSAIMKDDFQECGVQVDKFTFPSRWTQGHWRAGAEAAVLIQFGMEMSAAAHHGDKMGLGADGATVDWHVEGFIIATATCRLSTAPWEQGSKAGALTATNSMIAIARAMKFYTAFYETCNAQGFDTMTYPLPVSADDVILCLEASQVSGYVVLCNIVLFLFSFSLSCMWCILCRETMPQTKRRDWQEWMKRN
jgi:hypothetical protein